MFMSTTKQIIWDESPDCKQDQVQNIPCFRNTSPPHTERTFCIFLVYPNEVWQNTRNFKVTGNKCIKTVIWNICLQYKHANGMNLHKCYQRTERSFTRFYNPVHMWQLLWTCYNKVQCAGNTRKNIFLYPKSNCVLWWITGSIMNDIKECHILLTLT